MDPMGMILEGVPPLFRPIFVEIVMSFTQRIHVTCDLGLVPVPPTYYNVPT